MKHVVVCKDAPGRFRVFCDARGEYVLDDASESDVEDYFLAIATKRARDCVARLIAQATSSQPTTIPVCH